MINKIELKQKKIGLIGGKYLPYHLGHQYAIMETHNQVDKLYVLLSSSVKRDKILCKNIKYIPPEIRLSWLGESLKDFSNIQIIHIEDEECVDDYNWEVGISKIKQECAEQITHVFSSENEYTEIYKKYWPEVKHIVIDSSRSNINISATKIRDDIYNNWEFLPRFVKSFFTKRIAVVGTESCGKSTLVDKLSKFYNTNYVSEVGRKYCEKYKNELTTDMFNKISMEHYLLQDKLAESSDRILFIDSDAIITKYYLDMYLNKKSTLIEEIIKLQNFDLYLYLEPDIKWVSDGYRFAGSINERKKNNNKLKRMYKDYNINLSVVGGNFSERFNKSIGIINEIL